MYTPYNNVSCITGRQFIDMFGQNAYDNGVKRCLFIKHGRGGNGRDVFIEVNNRMRRDYREAIINEFGTIEKAATGSYIDNIVTDEKARVFFKELELDTNVYLSTEKVALYTNEATLLNTIQMVFEKQIRRMSAVGKRKSSKEFWNEAVDFVKEVSGTEEKPGKFPNKLPNNPISLKRKLEKYLQSGYISLISNYGNDNSQKITAEAGEWLVARYSSMHNRVTLSQLHLEYNIKAIEKGWKHLKSLEAIDIYLNKPEIKPKWYASRYGELNFKEKYTRQHRTLMPTLRDSLWYSDGTKLNYFYLNESGKVETCTVYEVIDTYSEVLMGHHVSKTEDYEAQYHAFKNALKFSEHKPYELKYDNQGGHSKLNTGGFLQQIAHLSLNTAPYNGKSKTIESIFGRFQSQFLHKDWFFTGQNIQAVKLESKVNMEFILANKNNLPTLPEIKEIYRKRREEWNNAPHPKTGIPRIEMYRNSVNEGTKKLELWDMIDIFWLMTDKPNTYRASGIEIQVKKERFAYEVLTTEGKPDLTFLANNVDRKFYVKYDPEDMTLAAIYTQDATGFRFVANLHPYIKVQRNIQEQMEGDMAFIKSMELANKAIRLQVQEESEALLERNGEHPGQHGLVMPKVKGITSPQPCPERRGSKKAKAGSLGEYMKEVSMAVADVEEDNVSLYDMY